MRRSAGWVIRWLDTWPPALWLAVYVGSLFVRMASARRPRDRRHGARAHRLRRGDPPCGEAPSRTSAVEGLCPADGRPGGVLRHLGRGGRPPRKDHAFATLLAGCPSTAATLADAAARRKTRLRDERRLEDASVDDLDPFPGVGMDDAPLEDTPERHDDITPHDLPREHPARRRAEQRIATTLHQGRSPTGRRAGREARAAREEADHARSQGAQEGAAGPQAEAGQAQGRRIGPGRGSAHRRRGL
jgi:hypothetical protein